MAVYTDSSDVTGQQAYATQYSTEPPPAQYRQQRQDRQTCGICKGPHDSNKCWAVNPKEAPEWWPGPFDYESWLRYADNCMKERLVPVQYRKRAAGKSKVSGTLKGVVLAGWKIISLIFILFLADKKHKNPRPADQ